MLYQLLCSGDYDEKGKVDLVKINLSEILELHLL